jgi:hypothetical protein
MRSGVLGSETPYCDPAGGERHYEEAEDKGDEKSDRDTRMDVS